MTTTPESLETPDAPDRQPATQAASPQAPAGEASPDYGVLRWLVAGTFIVILNETIMVNAIPRLMVEFSVDFRAAQWLTSAFMLTMAVVIPITGWFLQRVTTRQALGTAMSIFCAGTLLAALAPTFEVLLAGRIVQATGTAVMMPLLMTTLMTVVAERDRGRIMGNVTLAMSVAPALGPAVSGVILDVASWRWMFGVVLPIAALITVVGLQRLQNVGETVAGSVDWFSVALSAAGFGPLVYGLSQFGGDAAAWVPWTCVAVGLASIAVFVGRQLQLQRGGSPLLDLRALKHRSFTLALLLMSVAFMAMLGSMILLPTYLQEVRGLSELETGLLVMPGGLAMGLLGPQVGKIYDRVGGRPLVIPGSMAVLVALTLLTRVQVDTSMAYLLPVHILLMVGLAAVFTPVFTIGLGALPPELYSHGSSLLGTLQQVAAAAGAAIIAAVITARETSLLGDGVAALEAKVGGMEWGFGVGAILAIVVLAIAIVMPGRVAAGAPGSHSGH
ncbi:MDR family MFS transporter [Nocardioides sp. R-C-SC26]|uniref:MDR family MFS transporter n=1 Tax=Nocardioides sp. R-C-SC26 TaxID=2870414 RepID=UPI001E63B7E2|nr:MDR family MFS transporter [Nocardioides sp. R-C-SC26]